MGITTDFSSTYFVVRGPGPHLVPPDFYQSYRLAGGLPDRIEAQDEAENARGWHIIDLTKIDGKKRYLEDHPNVGLWDPFQMAVLWLINGGY